LVNSKIKKIAYLFFSLLMISALVIGFAGCQEATPTPEPSTGETVLTIAKGDQTVTYTMEALEALPAITGWAGQMSSTGTITGPCEYKGVSLSELLQAVGGITENNAVRVSAKDGYAMTLSYKQMTEGNFTIINSENGKECAPSAQPVVFVAYEVDGEPIGETVGPLRLGIMTAEQQVTEGHWWVKWTQKIEVIPVEAPWNLQLEGAITESMDQATFESGSAIGCHGLKWTDDQSRVWEGIPLWYLVGRVDDPTDTHKGDAFSDDLADAGYEVQIISADGYTVSLTSAEVKRNDALIISYKRDGDPLPENQWPLRLVGGTLTKAQMVGQIATIKLVFPGEAAETPEPTETTGATVLTVTSSSQVKTYTLDELKALIPISGYSGTKNKAGVITGPKPYTGVALTEVLNAVGGLTTGCSVKFTAMDGYAKTLTYDQITQGTFTTYDTSGNAVAPEHQLVVFLAYEADGAPLDEATGPVQLAIMTCQEQVTDGSNFVKQIENIEVITQ
jgi:hypothetical protein